MQIVVCREILQLGEEIDEFVMGDVGFDDVAVRLLFDSFAYVFALLEISWED